MSVHVRDFMARAGANGCGTIPNLEKMAAFFKKFRMAPENGRKKFYTSFLNHCCERFIEDLGDDIRVTPGFWILFRSILFCLVHMQSPVSGLASLLNEHEVDNMPRSPEAVFVCGLEFQSPFF